MVAHAHPRIARVGPGRLGPAVRIGGTNVVFRAGSADAITTVRVAGAGAPGGEVANLRFEPLAAERSREGPRA